MFGSERETPPSRLPLVGPSVAHSGAGSVNVNEGAGFQSNPTLSGGSHNQQFNAERIYYTARAETPPPPCAIIPFRRDPDYVPRQHLIDQIHQKLSAPAGRVALVGLGGVGKSLLAIEYSHWTRERSPDTWLLWLHASSSTRFGQSVRDVVEQLKIPRRNEPGANAFALLESWLRHGRRRWLLVLDNADDPRVLHDTPSKSESSPTNHQRTCLEYLPVCDHGSVLFTSRDKKAATTLVDDAEIIVVSPMDEEHAVALLEKKIARRAEMRYERDEAVELVRALDCMPLAIAQACAYIQQRAPRCSVRQYVEKLQKSDKSRASLLVRDEGNLRRDKEASNSIILTWQISFDSIRQSRPSAADLLALMSFCDREAIPEFLLRAGEGRENAIADIDRKPIDRERRGEAGATERANSDDSDDSDDSSSLFSRNKSFEDDLVTLVGYSFVSRTMEESTFEMHRLVQLSTRRWLEAQGDIERWKERFVGQLCLVMPSAEYENWAVCQKLLSHAQAAMPLKMAGGEASLQWASVMYHASWYALEQGLLVVAEKMAMLCYSVRMRQLGEAHPNTLVTMGNLASTYQDQGRWVEAEELEVKVMETRKKVLGETHPDTLASMGNLASTYWNQGRWGEAEELEVKVMETRKKV